MSLVSKTGRILALAFALLTPSGDGRSDDSASIRSQFPSPGREYSSGPLWTWNDLLTEEQVRSTLRDLAKQHVRQVWVHPRPGLMTPYLGEDWFRMWSAALDEAKRLDMNVWIYDENSYPSGFAGGLVPEALPDSRNISLEAKEHQCRLVDLRALGDDVIAAYRFEGEKLRKIEIAAPAPAAGTEAPAPADDPARYFVIAKKHAEAKGWFGGKWYVDLLKPGVTEKFLEITLEPYRQRFGEEFGKRIPGVFTDEPNLFVPQGLPWTADLPERFEKRWGYPLLENLPSLFRPVGDWKKVRHNYFQLVLEQFLERWAKPFYEYCDRHGLEFTGHYWEHGWPHATHGPDNMAMYAWMHRPGIDILFNHYEEHTAAQFGNVRAVRELASVANQLGKRRALCEAYGAAGWDLRLEDMKRIGDWMYALGVNTLNEHISCVTIRGARKTDHPQSFSYHAPWFEAYHKVAVHFTRLSLALSSGEQVHNILVLEPTTTAWLYQSHFDPSQKDRLEALGASFFDLLMKLESARVEYDLGCEEILKDHGAVKDGRFVVGRRSYDTVAIPSGVESLNRATVDLLEAYARSGGVVLCAGSAPRLVEGNPSDRFAALAGLDSWRTISDADLPALLATRQQTPLRIARNGKRPGNLFHHRRTLADGELLFLTNSDMEQAAAGHLEAAGFLGVERWDTETGAIGAYPSTAADGGLRCAFDLPPCGSLLLFFSKKAGSPASADPVKAFVTGVAAAGEIAVRRLDPNVLTLDYCDLRMGDERFKDLYCQAAAARVFQHHGMEDNPWSRAVQLRDGLIRKTFPAESGFAATYRFRIEGNPPTKLQFVVERADLYAVTCNGQAIQPLPDQWWLDKSFSVLDIAPHARAGDNEVTIEAGPLTVWHEIQPAYVVGEFALESAESGFVIRADDAPIENPFVDFHGINPDGTMWLTGGEGNATVDRRPFVVFDLGASRTIRYADIWNYNENHVVDLTTRGTDLLAISLSDTAAPGTFRLTGHFRLARTEGRLSPPQRLAWEAQTGRYVRFDLLSSHAGHLYPMSVQAADAGRVGLAEARFYDGEGAAIEDVRIHEVSSELSPHNRVARYLVDGSGLTPGLAPWTRTGMPLYGGRVAYSREFQIDQPAGNYAVRLGDWHGSVAQVMVNGEAAGYIGWRPWEIDVTGLIRPGRNKIEVVVFGTPKNPLGPHHCGTLRGIAGPGHFMKHPAWGPPPGIEYDTIEYGLFAPFELMQTGKH